MALLLALTGCAGEGGLFAPPRDQTGRSGGASGSSLLVGQWETVIMIDASPGDVQVWTTQWRFDAALTCRYHQTVVSVVEGTREKVRPCTWRDANSMLMLTWQDTGATEQLPYGFPSLDPNRLVLQGIEYRRLP